MARLDFTDRTYGRTVYSGSSLNRPAWERTPDRINEWLDNLVSGRFIASTSVIITSTVKKSTFFTPACLINGYL